MVNYKKLLVPAIALGFLLTAVPASAHFGMLIPSKSAVVDKRDTRVTLSYAFGHPFEGNAMDLKLKSASVTHDGKTQDITGTLRARAYKKKSAYIADYQAAKPGVYTFSMTPEPYWDKAEDQYLIHYTKTIVGALGDEEGWNEPVGLPVEIVPLTRPFATYAGGIFRGRVLHDGKPAANIPVEIEYLNGSHGSYKAPNEYYTTQVVMTDDQGIFCCGVPFAGWWGFAALVEGEGMQKDGVDKKVELGGDLWIEFGSPMKDVR